MSHQQLVWQVMGREKERKIIPNCKIYLIDNPSFQRYEDIMYFLHFYPFCGTLTLNCSALKHLNICLLFLS